LRPVCHILQAARQLSNKRVCKQTQAVQQQQLRRHPHLFAAQHLPEAHLTTSCSPDFEIPLLSQRPVQAQS
jgi:hypothetical protein